MNKRIMTIMTMIKATIIVFLPCATVLNSLPQSSYSILIKPFEAGLIILILQTRKPKHQKVKQLFQLEQLSCAVFSLLGWPFRPGHCGNICPEHSNLVVLLSSSSSLGFALRRLCPIPLALSVFSNFPKVTVVSWMKRRVAN